MRSVRVCTSSACHISNIILVRASSGYFRLVARKAPDLRTPGPPTLDSRALTIWHINGQPIIRIERRPAMTEMQAHSACDQTHCSRCITMILEVSRVLQTDMTHCATLYVQAVFYLETSTLFCIIIQLSRIRNCIGQNTFYIILEGSRLQKRTRLQVIFWKVLIVDKLV